LYVKPQLAPAGPLMSSHFSHLCCFFSAGSPQKDKCSATSKSLYRPAGHWMEYFLGDFFVFLADLFVLGDFFVFLTDLFILY
jgi:hypothetical protein